MDPRIRSKKFVRKPTPEEKKLLGTVPVPEEMIRVFPRIINPKNPYKGPKIFYNVSYMLIPPEKRKQSDMEGLIMIRAGQHSSLESAQMEAEKIIRERDSLNVNYIMQAEEGYILSSNPKYSKSNYKIKMNPASSEVAKKIDQTLTPEQEKLLDKEMADMVETRELAEEMVKEEETKTEKEQWDRIQKMRQEAERSDIEGTLEYYTKQRSKYNNLLMNIRKIRKQTKLGLELEERARKTLREILSMDKENPHYSLQWKSKEEGALAESGIHELSINTDLMTVEEYCDGDDVTVRNQPKASSSSST